MFLLRRLPKNRISTSGLIVGSAAEKSAAQPQVPEPPQDNQFAPNAVKKIITNPNPNSASAANSLHNTLYHCFPTTDQQSWIANQNAATAIAPKIRT
ncbi:MAG TPA: hypothetical protein VK813_12695 [Edaphobacter sp.]|jgi:hypothetical protein|nr:hypothetical protein [Edaphobacter sp.]